MKRKFKYSYVLRTMQMQQVGFNGPHNPIYSLTPTPIQATDALENGRRTAAESFLRRVGLPASKTYQIPPLPTQPILTHGYNSTSLKLVPNTTRLNENALRFVVNETPRGDLLNCPSITNGAAMRNSLGIDTRWFAKTGQIQ